MISGNHLVAGNWQRGNRTFRSSPYTGLGREYAEGTPQEVDQAVSQAAIAFESFSHSTDEQRAALLQAIASDIDANRDAILAVCEEETGLTSMRLAGEFARTVNQIRYFADTVLKGSYLDSCHVEALPQRTPLPRPDLKLKQRPVGPVAVFGASNFPLAFSAAGGDTASALAVGCPVIVKGHSAHPGTSELVAQCISRQIQASDFHPGIFSLIQSNSFECGQALVQHAKVKAVGFTGSLGGGRALYNLCAARAEPIPFFGELGSVNPVFMLPHCLTEQSSSLAKAWVASLTVGAGQMCTNPGLVVVQSSPAADAFIDEAKTQVQSMGEHVMLGENIAQAYRDGHDNFRNSTATVAVQGASCSRRSVTASIYRTTAKEFLVNPFIAEEVFGPLGVVVEADTVDEVFSIAESLSGQLTCTLHATSADRTVATQLFNVLEHKAGRLLFNDFPTGVEVCDAMVHGGPYPASTNFGATSVGSMSMRRFLRPVCYQNLPQWIEV